MYVVTYWEGQARSVETFQTLLAAHARMEQLRARSDTLQKTSFVPIRAMPRNVYDRMQAMSREPEKRCVHRGIFRLCIPCVTDMLAKEELQA